MGPGRLMGSRNRPTGSYPWSGASASALSSLPPHTPTQDTVYQAGVQEAALQMWFGDCLHPQHPVSALASGEAGSLFPSRPQLTSDPWSQTEQDSALFLHTVLQKCERTPVDTFQAPPLHKTQMSSPITPEPQMCAYPW